MNHEPPKHLQFQATGCMAALAAISIPLAVIEAIIIIYLITQ